DSDDIYKYRINVRKNADTEIKDAEKTINITKETTEQPLTSSSFSVPYNYGNQFLNLSHNEEIFKQPPVLQPTTPIPTTITTQPINTEASAITTAIPEITPFITLQLRVAKLEQDMSEVKKFDHSADVLASIQSQVPPVVDKYLGTKLDDALLKTLERHTADLVEKYSMLPTLESSKKQESKKSQEEIIRIKREQEEKNQEPTYTIKSSDQAALEEFDLKSALFKSMHKNKSANRNPANYRLYHALIEALIEDGNAMDKEVADTVRDHKRKHDADEGPPAGSNQGKSTKRRRIRESESAKKPSTTKEYSKDKDLKVGSNTGKSAPAKDSVEEPTDKVMVDEQYTEDISISDEGHVSDPEDTDNAHMPKILDTTTWFRPILEEERPASPEPEWVIPPIDLPEADNNWANAFAKAHQDPDENKLHNKIDDIGSFIRWYCRRIGKEELSKADLEGPAFMMVKGFHENNISLQFQMEECHKLLTNQIDLVNPEGHSDGIIVIRKRVKDLQLGIESYQTKLNLEQHNWDVSNFPFKEDYTIVFKPRAVIYRDRDDNRKMMRIDEVHKFSDGTLTRIKEKLKFMVKDFKLFKFNKGMENRKWTEDDKRRSEDFIEDTLPILLSFTHCGNKSILRVLCIILVILPEHPSETKVFHNEDGNPARANIKQALGSYERSHKGVKAFANSDIVYFFTSAQDGDPLQDDVRLCLGDDLKKAQDKKGEALQAKKAEALKSAKAESSNANKSKTLTKRKPIWYLDIGCSRHMTGVKSYLHKYVEQPGPQFDEKRGTIFNSNKEVVMISPRVRDVYVLNMTSSTQESCFFAKAFYNLNWLYPPDKYLHPYEPSQRYQTNNNDVSFIEPYESPKPVVLETKVSSDHNGQADQNDHNDQSAQTDEILNDDQSKHSNHTNDKQIINNLPNTKYIQISKHLSSPNEEDTSVYDTIPNPNCSLSIPSITYLAPQDRWSQDKHIKMVNIIGDPRDKMLTRAMAKELSSSSAHECLFVDFLSGEEPKKISKSLKHPIWVDAMQEELN
ncbi:hypothetical protein Tco_0919629, partial [Tanacetum coccineum]